MLWQVLYLALALLAEKGPVDAMPYFSLLNMIGSGLTSVGASRALHLGCGDAGEYQKPQIRPPIHVQGRGADISITRIRSCDRNCGGHWTSC